MSVGRGTPCAFSFFQSPNQRRVACAGTTTGTMSTSPLGWHHEVRSTLRSTINHRLSRVLSDSTFYIQLRTVFGNLSARATSPGSRAAGAGGGFSPPGFPPGGFFFVLRRPLSTPLSLQERFGLSMAPPLFSSLSKCVSGTSSKVIYGFSYGGYIGYLCYIGGVLLYIGLVCVMSLCVL